MSYTHTYVLKPANEITLEDTIVTTDHGPLQVTVITRNDNDWLIFTLSNGHRTRAFPPGFKIPIV